MNNNLTEPYVSAGQLNIPAGIFFTRQPQRAAASGPDQTAVFKVTAINAVSYQWQYDDGSGWTDLDGAESDTFEIVIGPAMHGWKFRCIVEDADGASAASAAAAITVSNTSKITVSGAIATIDYGPVDIHSLIVDINAVQSGTGDPSPENVRPIVGWDEINVYVSPTEDAADGTATTITLPQTVYGGTLDVTSGVLTVTHGIHNLGDCNWYAYPAQNGFSCLIDGSGSNNFAYGLCSHFKILRSASAMASEMGIAIGANNAYFYACHITDNMSSITDSTSFKAWLAENNVKLVYPLATPQTITLTPTEVSTVLGYNNIFADSGEVEVIYKGWPNADPESELVGLGSLSPNVIQDVFTPGVIEDNPQTLDITPEFDTLL